MKATTWMTGGTRRKEGVNYIGHFYLQAPTGAIIKASRKWSKVWKYARLLNKWGF